MHERDPVRVMGIADIKLKQDIENELRWDPKVDSAQALEDTLCNNARAMTLAARAPLGADDFLEVQHRAEGEFLRKLVAELQPMLHEAMRSRRIFLE